MAPVGRNEPCPCGSGKKFKKCCAGPRPPHTPSDRNDGEDLFGRSAAYPISLLESFAQEAQPASYRIIPTSEYDVTKDLARSNEIYWREILYRAHFGSSTALLRLREWLRGAVRAHSDCNVLMLAAGLRGLLEAAADTFDGLTDVASTLADNHSVVRDALAGRLGDQLYLLPELENDLIHFAYAARQRVGAGEYSPKLHEAKTAHDCISVLAEGVPQVKAAYETLCNYSHPAAPTVFRFATEEADRHVLKFDPHAGARQLSELRELARQIGPAILVLSIGSCVVNLKTLNALALDAVTTPWAAKVSLEFSSVWRIVEEKLRRAGRPQIASAEQEARIMKELFRAYEPRKNKKSAKK